MRPSKKLMTTLLPTLPGFDGYAAGGLWWDIDNDTNDLRQSYARQASIEYAFLKRYFRYQDVRSGSVDGRALHPLLSTWYLRAWCSLTTSSRCSHNLHRPTA